MPTTLVLVPQPMSTAPAKRPDDGCCVRGLYIEGARWNSAELSLEESKAKELYTGMPYT